MTVHIADVWWTRESVQNDPDRYYIFGDNEEGWGTGGQACIRGLANAYGIPSLKAPGVFWSDDQYASNVAAIEAAIAKIPTDKPWVISKDGIGTGLAELPTRAPRTNAYLQDRLASLTTPPNVVPASGIAPEPAGATPSPDPSSTAANPVPREPGAANPALAYLTDSPIQNEARRMYAGESRHGREKMAQDMIVEAWQYTGGDLNLTSEQCHAALSSPINPALDVDEVPA